MNEEELKAKEAELTTKEEDLKKREEDMQKREDALKEKEDDLKKREEDVNGLVGKVTKEYEAKLAKQKDEYEKRLEEREKVIKQLLNGEGAVDNTPSEIEELNARRRAQRRGWPLRIIKHITKVKKGRKKICQQIKVVAIFPLTQTTF